jgi:hypothetical protein
MIHISCRRGNLPAPAAHLPHPPRQQHSRKHEDTKTRKTASDFVFSRFRDFVGSVRLGNQPISWAAALGTTA